jgi:hypothetical protein
MGKSRQLEDLHVPRAGAKAEQDVATEATAIAAKRVRNIIVNSKFGFFLWSCRQICLLVDVHTYVFQFERVQ